MNEQLKNDIICQVCIQQDGMPGSRSCKPILDIRDIDIDKCPIRIEVARRFFEVLTKDIVGGKDVRDQTQKDSQMGLLKGDLM